MSMAMHPDSANTKPSSADPAAHEGFSFPIGSSGAAAEQAARIRIVEARERALRERGWRGSWMLLVRETRRFMGMAAQTLLSPVLTTMLYFVVFGFTLGSRLAEVRGVPYMDFLVPGLIMLNLINSAYMNSAFSLFLAKIHGSVVDLLVTPLSPLQLMLGYIGASVLRAMLTGGVIWAVAAMMGAGTFHSMGWTLVFMFLTSVAFALVGLVVAILAEDFDHVNFLPSFLLMPLTFLGGVFYSIEMLPEPWTTVSKFNPILYMVNGLRYGMTGVTDVPVMMGLVIVSGLVLVFGWIAATLLASGRKLREGR
jgi:ABC-2 type transport system permease protein